MFQFITKVWLLTHLTFSRTHLYTLDVTHEDNCKEGRCKSSSMEIFTPLEIKHQEGEKNIAGDNRFRSKLDGLIITHGEPSLQEGSDKNQNEIQHPLLQSLYISHPTSSIGTNSSVQR